MSKLPPILPLIAIAVTAFVLGLIFDGDRSIGIAYFIGIPLGAYFGSECMKRKHQAKLQQLVTAAQNVAREKVIVQMQHEKNMRNQEDGSKEA